LDDDLVLVQPIDVFGRVRASRALGDAEIARAQAELGRLLAELQDEVIKEFSQAAAAKARVDNALQLQDIAERLHDAIRILVDEGKLPGVQLSRMAIEVERAQLTSGQRSAELRASLQRLGGILGLPSAQLEVADFASLKIGFVEPDKLPSRIADLRLLAAEVSSAQAHSRIASLRNRPDLEIQGRQTSWHDSDRQFGVRVQLAIPLNDFGRTRSETAAAQTRTEALKRDLADAVRVAESELQATRTELEAAHEQVKRYQDIVSGAISLVEKSRVGFMEKAVTLVELLESTRALRETEEGLVDARLRLARAQASYLKASGHLLEVGK